MSGLWGAACPRGGLTIPPSCCPFGHMTVRATGAVSHPDWAGSSGNKGRFVNDIALIFVEPEGGGDAADIPAE